MGRASGRKWLVARGGAGAVNQNSDTPRYIDYVRACARRFDRDGGADKMNQHQLNGLRDVHPTLADRLEREWLMVLEQWIYDHWNDVKAGEHGGDQPAR